MTDQKSVQFSAGLPQAMTERTARLKESLYDRAFGDRSGEWFSQNMFADMSVPINGEPEQPVIIRRSRAISEMLSKMTSPEISATTGSYHIEDGELLVGVLPMGSNGLGKVFPNYQTENEKRACSITNRTQLSLLGHNTADYERLLRIGLSGIIDICHEKQTALKKKDSKNQKDQDAIDFYQSVLICCEAVIGYAQRYADLAENLADNRSGTRRQELLEIAAICRKVPLQQAETFHEALQSIWTVHVALHASLNYISFGRLDQVLQPYAEKSMAEGMTPAKMVELLECFLIKGAGRLNLSCEYLMEQDHMDYNAALGIHPYYLDQLGAVNNFLQNIIVGGKTKQGEDATNNCTYLILQAFINTNLSTPGIYVRLHKKSPTELRDFVAHSLAVTGNNPSILNDEALIPAMYNALLEDENPNDQARMSELRELANDYCVDGCWEPILNARCDWTFGMINGMILLECALNRGATLDPNPMVLRGGKNTPNYGTPTNYEELKEIMSKTIQFSTDQCGIGFYKYYQLDEYVNPSPLYSAFLGACLENGRDKAAGGADYNIAGIILGGVPNMVNTITAIRRWVFEEQRYKYDDVLNALKFNFVSPSDSNPKEQAVFNGIKADFMLESPKFGNDDRETNHVAADLLDMFVAAVKRTKEYCDHIFLAKEGCADSEELRRLRTLAGFYGPPLQAEEGRKISVKFTAGLGTFEQYTMQGSGVAASADRDRAAPLAPNFTPTPGTMKHGIGHLLSTLGSLDLSRFGAGVITDTCLRASDDNPDTIKGIIDRFIEEKGNMMTMAVGRRETYQEIYELSVAAARLENREAAQQMLRPYADINVRVGGWHAPFITMSPEQQKDYINRPVQG